MDDEDYHVEPCFFVGILWEFISYAGEDAAPRRVFCIRVEAVFVFLFATLQIFQCFCLHSFARLVLRQLLDTLFLELF